MPRRSTSRQLDDFIVRDMGFELEVTCPYKNCKQTHTVDEAAWREGRNDLTSKTRPCPYCFRVSVVPPAEHEDTEPDTVPSSADSTEEK